MVHKADLKFKALAVSACLAWFGVGLLPQALAQDALWQTYFTEAVKALQANDPETAEKMFTSAAEQAQTFPENDQRYYKTLDGLALVLTARKKYADAEKTYQKVLSVKSKVFGADNFETALTMSGFADLMLTEGRYKQAEIMYQTALKNLGSNAAVFAEKSQNLGICLTEEAQYAKAEEALQNARAKEVELYGQDSSQVFSTTINLINMHLKQGAYKNAENEGNQTLKALRNVQPPDQKSIDACMAALERINERMGHFAKAEEYAKELIKHAEAGSDSSSPEYARAFERLANVYVEEHRYAEAEPLYVKARNLLEKTLPGHPYVADCLVDQAELLIDLGKYSDAESLLQQALSIRQSSLGSEHPDVAECLIDLAYIDAQQNKPAEAEIGYKRALAIKLKSVGEAHPDYAKALCQLGQLYASLHRNDEAESSLTKALALREKILPPDHPDIAGNMAQLAVFYKDASMGAKAEAMYRRLKARDEKYEPNNVTAKVSDLNGLSAALSLLGKPDDAAALAKQAAQLRKGLPGGAADVNEDSFVKASVGAGTPITDKWCLCIGISNFKDSSINLKFAAKDATDFRNFLVANGNFKKDHVKLLTDGDATRENILDQLGSKWLGPIAKSTDLVVIYVSSHGSQALHEAGGTNFLVAYDTNKESLLSSGIPMQWLSEMVKEQVHSNRILLILDVCHSGSATSGVGSDGSDGGSGTASAASSAGGSGSVGGKGLNRIHDVDLRKLTAGSGQVILCSSAADQVSWESTEYPNSVFTKRLIESLQSKGVSTNLTDAYKLLKSNVESEVLRDRSAVQTPLIKQNWQGGELAPLIVAPSN